MRGVSTRGCWILAWAALACGGTRQVSDDGAASSTSGSSGSATSSSEVGDSAASTNGEVDSTAEGTSDEDTGAETQCIIALALDTCCSQPRVVSAQLLEDEDCLVAWPVDWSSLPADLLASCVALQPEFCEVVDCDYLDPPTRAVQLDESGECAWLCPQGESIAYLNPGCEEPPPIATCTPPPPPCVMEYCSCDAQTITGCGQTGVPHAHVGPCE